jgi:flagellar hook-associated protein 2
VSVNSVSTYDSITLLVQVATSSQRSRIQQAKTEQTTLGKQLTAYQSVQAKLQALSSAALALQGGYGSIYRTLLATSNTTSLVTASASSSAIAGNYSLTVGKLARAHVSASAAFSSADALLGATAGTLYLRTGPTATTPSATASVSDAVATTSVTGYSTSAVTSGLKQLGAGDYKVQVRYSPDDGTTVQYRLADENGEAVSITGQAGTGATGVGWKTLTGSGVVTVNSGRGLSFTVDAGVPLDTSAASLTYHASAPAIAIGANETLSSLAVKINTATYAEGDEVRASVVSNQLVLQSARTGVRHTVLSSATGTDVLTRLSLTTKQDALNAEFTVNGISAVTSKNTGISGIVSGLTLSLLGTTDVGKDVAVAVAPNASTVVDKVKAFLTAVNDAFSELRSQTRTSTSGSGKDVTYTRAPLAGQYSLTGLRASLLQRMTEPITLAPSADASSPRYLSDIGVTWTSDGSGGFTFSLSDESKLKAAFDKSTSAVEDLLNEMASTTRRDGKLGVTGLLTQYLDGSKGVLPANMKTVTDAQARLGARLTSMQTSLTRQESALRLRYGQMISSLQQYQNSASSISTLWGVG